MQFAAKPDTIFDWFRKLGPASSTTRVSGARSVGPGVDEAVEDLMVQMAQDNPMWGYDRIVGALANVGHHLSDRTVGNIVRRQGISPAPQCKPTTLWRDFIRAYMDVLVGTDFFTVDVLSSKGLVTYYVLFFIHVQTQRVGVAGLTPCPDHRSGRSKLAT